MDFGLFLVGAVIYTADWVFVSKLLSEHLFSFLLDSHLGVAESYGSSLMSHLKHWQNVFHNVCTLFTFLPVMYNNSNVYILRICLWPVAAVPTGVLCPTVALMHASLSSPRALNTFSTHWCLLLFFGAMLRWIVCLLLNWIPIYAELLRILGMIWV